MLSTKCDLYKSELNILLITNLGRVFFSKYFEILNQGDLFGYYLTSYPIINITSKIIVKNNRVNGVLKILR